MGQYIYFWTHMGHYVNDYFLQICNFLQPLNQMWFNLLYFDLGYIVNLLSCVFLNLICWNWTIVRSAQAIHFLA